jgi:hypothetical protein
MRPVDPSSEPFERAADALIALDRAARRWRDLKQDDFLALRGMIGEEPLIAEEPLFEAFRVVKPVDADDQGPADRAFPHALESLSRPFAVGQRSELAGVDANRTRDHPHRSPAGLEHAARSKGAAELFTNVIAE